MKQFLKIFVVFCGLSISLTPYAESSLLPTLKPHTNSIIKDLAANKEKELVKQEKMLSKGKMDPIEQFNNNPSTTFSDQENRAMSLFYYKQYTNLVSRSKLSSILQNILGTDG